MTGDVKNTTSMRLHPCDSILHTNLGGDGAMLGLKEERNKNERAKSNRAEIEVEGWEGRGRVITGTDMLV